MNKRFVPTIAAFALGFVTILGGLFTYQWVNTPSGSPPAVAGLLWPNPKPIGDFELADQTGKVFDRSRIKGKWTFWYFGYTNCPDACPTTLSVMNGIDKELETSPELRQDVQFSFVSVDPARDSIEKLARYVKFFNPEFIASTGPKKRLAELTSEFGVLVAPQPPDEAGYYLIDHTAALLLTDPQARFIALFQTPHKASEIAERFRKIRRFVEG